MTRYVGKHRTPPKWTPKKTIATVAITGGFMSLSATTGVHPATHDNSPVLSLAARYTTKVKTITTPKAFGNDQQAFNDWVQAGEPGFIPDNHDSKGLVSPVTPEPGVKVVQAVCDKPDLPGLSDDALLAYHTICALFPEITTFYGFRAGDQDHGTGNAIDNMVYGDTATGDALAQFLIDHADELHVKYIIWKQRIIGGYTNWQWQAMEDRGSPTANHYDHVHLSVN